MQNRPRYKCNTRAIYMVVVNYILTLWASCMKVVIDNHHTTSKNVAVNQQLLCNYSIDVYNNASCMHCHCLLYLEISTPL